MSAIFAAAELAAMRATQQGAMQDTCQIGVQTSAADAEGQLVATYTYGTAIVCGINFKPSNTQRSEWRTSDGTLVNVDTTARLPHGTAVNAKDRLKVVTRFGETLATALVFDVQGEPVEGPSGIEVGLTAVTT
jgi:hypothetical protein